MVVLYIVLMLGCFIFYMSKMSRKIITFSVLSLCLFLCGCWSKDNNVNNECLDWDTCLEETNVVEVAEKEKNNEEIQVIESDIEWFDENSGEITVAEKLSWEPIVISWEGREDGESNEIVNED